MVRRKLHRHHPGKDHKAPPTSSHLLIPLVMFVNILLCLFLASCTGSVQLARHIHSTSFWTLILLFIEVFVPSTYARFTSLCSHQHILHPALALFTITTHTDVWTWVIRTLPPHPHALLLVLHFWVKLFLFHVLHLTKRRTDNIPLPLTPHYD